MGHEHSYLKVFPGFTLKEEHLETDTACYVHLERKKGCRERSPGYLQSNVCLLLYFRTKVQIRKVFPE